MPLWVGARHYCVDRATRRLSSPLADEPSASLFLEVAGLANNVLSGGDVPRPPSCMLPVRNLPRVPVSRPRRDSPTRSIQYPVVRFHTTSHACAHMHDLSSQPKPATDKGVVFA